MKSVRNVSLFLTVKIYKHTYGRFHSGLHSLPPLLPTSTLTHTPSPSEPSDKDVIRQF